MNITINSRDLPYTIDTYGMFTGDSAEEMEAEYLAEQYGLTEAEQFELEWDYNHPAIVRDFALESVNILANGLEGKSSGGIVLAISLPENARSPQFYNYTTDSYDATWTIDKHKLLKFADKHKNGEGQTFREYRQSISWGDMDEASEDYIVAALDFVLPYFLDVESYEDAMFEAESTIYIENMKLEAVSQQLIESKEAKA